MADSLDLDQLQAQLELKRSALADSILSKLPGLEAASSSQAPPEPTSRPRHSNLGLGATPKQQSGSNGKSHSAADVRLKGALTAKRKRQEEPLAQVEDEEEEETSRAGAIGKKAKPSGSSNGKGAKKDPFAATGVEAQRAAQNQPRIVVVDGESVDLSKLSKTQRKKINKQLKAQELSTSNEIPTVTAKIAPAASSSSPTKALSTTSTSSTAPALTPLQAQMLSKLSGSRFRTINEKLYTTASTEAVRMIDAAPAMFDEYHAGFREQVRSWPKNPLDRIVELFDASSSSAKGKKKGVAEVAKGGKARFSPGALVVDLGAGEGGLAKKLVPKGIKVLCYDLVTTSDGWVRKQDTAALHGLPLPGFFDSNDPLGLHPPPEGAAPGVADVAVFCLSLMGTNWIHMLLEAKRVLRTGGELIIAEVSSRFADGFEAFVKVVKMLGFKLDGKDASNTHFVLFEFTKLGREEHVRSLEGVEGSEIDPNNTSLDELAEHGKSLLKPCIYKRR
ncbi:Methyltransferase-related [Kalmanozyma brasiliensis GHG001]|uniref:Methyltransferase-related n=1 Tax=Kalmanozyma brasiliensis (strain GHG001) TaxID=1365824 RepID=UPI002867EAF1|nr:Methyltransferase-related [Kalmanozyma brasiliensis GHG001]KAF6766892.1 Methyltransferase-related [Kalmanozyma brasiliensis GHG001]